MFGVSVGRREQAALTSRIAAHMNVRFTHTTLRERMWMHNTRRCAKLSAASRQKETFDMAKASKKKTKANKKSARVNSKPKAAARSVKTAKKKPARKKNVVARKIDPLNRNAYRSVTPMLAVADIRRAMNFYTTALGFKVKQVMDSPQGIMHAELTLRDTTLMLGPESREQGNLA